MHRLKEWFGIKDWEGPKQNPENVATESTTVETSSDTVSSAVQSETGPPKQAEYEHTTSQTVTDGVIQSRKQGTENIFFKYNSQFESWLKQYIPVKHNECAQCRLVVATFMGSIAAALMYKTYENVKASPMLKSKQMNFKVFIFSYSALSAFLLHDWLFKKGMYQEKKEKETKKEFLLRTLKEDMDWYKCKINKMQDKIKKATTVIVENESEKK